MSRSRDSGVYEVPIGKIEDNLILIRWWQEIIEQTEELLEAYKHPDPYRPPTAPGGSKYQRNLPAPILDRESSLPNTINAGQLDTDSDSAAPPMTHKEMHL